MAENKNGVTTMIEISLDRATLVDILGVRLKIETPPEREVSVRIGVDWKLAKLFGAKFHVGIDWNFRKPTYTLEEIQHRLNDTGINITAQLFVKEHLIVREGYKLDSASGQSCIDYEVSPRYFFQRVVDAKDRELYLLSYEPHRCDGNGWD